MIFGRKSLLQAIIEALQKGPLSTQELLHVLRLKRTPCTKQGMYRALRVLIKDEIVLKHKSEVSLSLVWVSKLHSFTALAEHFYVGNDRRSGFLGLVDGEKIKYEFQNLNVTDAFWTHALYLLIEAYPKTPLLIYNPHGWFFLARPESERALKQFVIKHGGQYLLMVGSHNPLDEAIAKEFDKSKSQYFMRSKPLFPKDTHYVNIIGDYIIEVWVDQKQTASIEEIYKTASGYSEDVKRKLHEAINAKGRTRLVISHDRKRAEKFAVTLSKPFYIPKLKR